MENPQRCTDDKPTTSDEFEELYPSYIANSAFNAFLCYTAVMLNSVTIYAIRKTSSLPKTLKTLLLSLVLSDLGVGFICQPFYVTLLVKWLQRDHSVCTTAFTVIRILFTLASFLGVTALSADRFLAIHLHLRYKALVTHKRVLTVVISIWVFSLFISLNNLWIPWINSVVLAIIVAVCFISAAIVHCKIYFAIEALQVQQRSALSGEMMTNVATLKNAAVSSLYLYLVFLGCYLPGSSILFAILVSGSNATISCLSLYSLTLVFLNSSLNPLIYCWKMRHIRNVFMHIIRNVFLNRY